MLENYGEPSSKKALNCSREEQKREKFDHHLFSRWSVLYTAQETRCLALQCGIAVFKKETTKIFHLIACVSS